MIFLKLGGSLITNKAIPETPRPDIILRMAEEIAVFRQQHADNTLLLGHGSGSFGHHAASTYQTQLGASTPEEWLGFSKVWHAAQRLNRLVIDELHSQGVPAVTFPPSTSAVCQDGRLIEMETNCIRSAFDANLLPVVHGDVAFDGSIGCTILSTEAIFTYLAGVFQPTRILLAGVEPGVYADPSNKTTLLQEIHAVDLKRLALSGSGSEDVTGGMAAKVHEALAMAQACPLAEIYIFSPAAPGALTAALEGGHRGTRLLA
ncbi:MAG: isopentenyl phosphate kinase family protein [Anaerolineales bacterium]|nr:isopentenyl phosphate kinase family protein [Anaerolineales bacterium]